MLCPNGTVKPFLVSLVEPVAYLKSELLKPGDHCPSPVVKLRARALGMNRPTRISVFLFSSFSAGQIRRQVPPIAPHPHLGQSWRRLFLTRFASPSIRPTPHP